MRSLRTVVVVVMVSAGGVIPATATEASAGPSGTSYEIATVCSTGSMTVRADATAVSGSGDVSFTVASNGTSSEFGVARGSRAGVTVRGVSAIPSGVVVTEGSTTVASAQYGQTCASNPLSAASDVSHFVPLTPVRVLDTRPDHAVGYTGPKPLANGIVVLQLAGVAGIASDATAVVLNLTATEPVGPGYVQAFPNGRGNPGASSNVNIERAGETIPNAAIVRLGDDGAIGLFVTTSTHLIADVAGYFVPAQEIAVPSAFVATGGRFQGVGPTRVFDTRPGHTVQYSGAKPLAGSTVDFAVFPTSEAPDVPVAPNLPNPSTIGSVVLNVTATESSGPGFVQVAPGGALVPGASSNLNLNAANQTIPNLVIVPVSSTGTVSVHTSAGTHLIADVLGYFTNDSAANSRSGLFVPLDPERVLDSRLATRVDGGEFVGAAGSSTTVRFEGLPDVPGAVVLNVTATETGAPGFVQVGPNTVPGGMTFGAHSNLNVERADETIPNLVISQSGQQNIDGVTFYTSGQAHLLADIAGWFTFTNTG
jgi:hypothetical protein